MKSPPPGLLAPESAIQRTNITQSAGIHRAGRRDTGAWNCRLHGGVQRLRCHRVAAASLCQLRAAGHVWDQLPKLGIEQLAPSLANYFDYRDHNHAFLSDILRLVMVDGMAPALIGMAAGLTGALALSRVLRSMLFGASPADSMRLIAAAVILAVVGLAACYLPARRALPGCGFGFQPALAPPRRAGCSKDLLPQPST